MLLCNIVPYSDKRQCRKLKDCISLIPAMNCGDGATRASLPTVINQTFLFDCRERRPRRSCKSPCDLLKLKTLPHKGGHTGPPLHS